ncbi:MAG: hypothetical protein QOD95_2511 [Gammaproteobacteria bacterium]|jgi:hypothetical protein|nr:hypothetical protein [Gammaproteobacteria bacterium]
MRNKASLAEKLSLKWPALIGLSLVATTALAQDVSIPDCALKPPKPSRVVTVPGFAAEPLYIHRKYPGGCLGGEDSRCRGAYVISGDQISVSESCANWGYVEYLGKRKVSGWVASARLPDPAAKPPPIAESFVQSAHPACLEAETLLNERLQKGEEPVTALRSALTNRTELKTLPAGVGDVSAGGGMGWDVQVQGQRLKAIAYGLGGSCSVTFLELWKPGFSERISLTGSNVDDHENAWASDDDLVRLRGRTYFVHRTRPRSFQFASFDKHLATSAICKIEQFPTQQEVILFAAEKDLCDAVATGRIEGAPIVDIGPIDVQESALQESVDSEAPIFGLPHFQMIGRGSVDIDNDGTPDDVGLVVYDEVSGAGCGHEFHTTWPVKLNADGTPVPHSAFNRTTLQGAGGRDDDARIFSFNGMTYVEYRSRKDADGLPRHEVWKYTTKGSTKMCALIPVRYRATDIH